MLENEHSEEATQYFELMTEATLFANFAKQLCEGIRITPDSKNIETMLNLLLELKQPINNELSLQDLLHRLSDEDLEEKITIKGNQS